MKSIAYHLLSILVSLSWAASPARAGVADSSAAGFTVRSTIVVRSTPDDAYRALTVDLGKWWNPAHTYSGKSQNLSLDVAGTGCFCEQLDNGGIVRHMTVVYANPGKSLRLQGGLGPIQQMAATGTLTWEFKTTATGLAIEMTYTVGGYDPEGLARFAGVVDRVLAEQMDRLKNFLDTGNPVPAGR